MKKPKPKSYCEYVLTLEKDNLHKIYHDTAYGFPIQNDDELFERLVLEINQAGLSWDTILKKQKNFQKAFHKFNTKKVAQYGARDRARLLADAGIIRNRLKVDATIHNAGVILKLQKEFGSFKNWLDLSAKAGKNHPQKKEEWVKIFKQTFHFTGREIVREFLMSTGYLEGAHVKTCKLYKR